MAMEQMVTQVAPVINSGNNAWVLMSSALVLLMTPGLSLFYAGLVPSRNAINTMNLSFICLAVIPIIWVLVGYSLAFAPGNAFIGDFSYALLRHVSVNVPPGTSLPSFDPMIFQLMFAIVTPAFISGALVGRMRFKAYVIFVALWSVCVYSVIAHWVWSPNGWLNQLGALDFAGGTVVHINAGFAALAATIILAKEQTAEANIGELPPNVPLVILGSALLWFGWFGFNAGSTGAANAIASLAFVTTTLATAAAVFAWMVTAWMHGQPITAVGSAVAVVIGLVAITPAAGYVEPLSAMLIGAIAAIICYHALIYKTKMLGRVKDPLDVFICHGISGIVGVLLTGVFASKLINPAGGNGLLYGNPSLLWDQFVAVGATVCTTMIGTTLILLILKQFININPVRHEVTVGSNVSKQGESACELNAIVKELFESKQALQAVNSQLVEEIAERKRAEKKAASLNNQLVVAARRAGMTDIATSVLHNIGNVLNSINTSVAMIEERLLSSEVSNLSKLKTLLTPFLDNPQALAHDERCPKMLKYMSIMADAWGSDDKYIKQELKDLEKNIAHIKTIICMQQSLSATIGVTEETNIQDLLEDALALNKTAYERADIEIKRDFSNLNKVIIDRVKLLQVLVNLIKNSIDSLLASGAQNKKVFLSFQALDSNYFLIKVGDNGLGIAPENTTKIFSYGFTTKKTGHGFGLHTSALAAKEMGGELNVESDGLGLGATFTLKLPYAPLAKGEYHANAKS